MRQVYQMFQGSLAPETVLKAAGSDLDAQFYAQLYLGLYAEAEGRNVAAFEHLKIAAADRFAPAGGYMHMVARVHLQTLQKSR
jgi:hypothetical protein